MPVLCRDCFSGVNPPGATGCAACGSARLIAHDELERLTIAHIDCDAFYAAVEKRDDPALGDKPVIVGGGKRGVAMTCCYVARRFGVHSAMPMYKALAACPDAIVIRPDMEKYGRIGREVRDVMLEATPMVEPISIDEAFLDLSGTERLHRGSAARTLADLALRIEDRIGITVSTGLSYNKFLAKIASGLDKPRGYSVIGRAEAVGFLAEQPVRLLWGVGEVMQARLASDGIVLIGQLLKLSEAELIDRYGRLGSRLARFSRGLDQRKVDNRSGRKSLSAETTFSNDISDPKALERRLWPLSETVSRRLKDEGIGGHKVTLKLKRADFKLRTRAATLAQPTQLAEAIWQAGIRLLDRETDGTKFRLIGIGVSNYAPAAECDPPDLADPGSFRRKEIERTMDSVRQRFGRDAIVKGRNLAE